MKSWVRAIASERGITSLKCEWFSIADLRVNDRARTVCLYTPTNPILNSRLNVELLDLTQRTAPIVEEAMLSQSIPIQFR